MGVMPVSRRTQLTTSWVRWRVLPPAPYVTETKLGPSGSSSAMVRPRLSWAPSVFGGKNSNENVLPDARRSAIRVMGAAQG